MKTQLSLTVFVRAATVAAAIVGCSALVAADAEKKGGKGGKGGKAKAGSVVSTATAADLEPFVARWALSLSSGAAGWLEVKKENGWIDGALLWGGGSVLPAANVTVDKGVLTVTMVRPMERKDAAGKTVRTQQITSTLTAHLDGDTLKGTRVDPRPNGVGFTTTDFTGKKIPPLPPRPDLAKMKFGAPVPLFNGKDLGGWAPKETNLRNAWVVENGALVNQVAPYTSGGQRERTANLRTERAFEDFKLSVEVNVPKGSNSGVYLRGIYEIQVLDSMGKPLDSHNMGALYSRITPSVGAEKAAGEWQTMEMTLVDRHITVVLNGKTIIDNQPALGCTGGAMTSDEFKPGPISLQGDHGPVSYRNLVLRPVVK